MGELIALLHIQDGEPPEIPGRFTQAIRRNPCDTGIHRLITGANGVIIDYSCQTRSVSDAQFDLPTIRDHGCRVPGCPIPPGGCDTHHSVHWANNSNTDLDNLVLLYWYHHHLLHEQHRSLEPHGAGHFMLRDPHETIHPLRPPIIGPALPAPHPLAPHDIPT